MTTLPPPEEHLAPAEHHPLPKTTWQRWRDWSGTNFVISVLIHLVVILLAMLLVVQVMQPREKPKFKAGPPSPNPPAEHSVKVKKSASMSVPTISKRITTTAANASVALPAMEMSAQMPDMMSGALSNLGASGLGAGAGTGGVGDLAGGGLISFFGRKVGAGLKGHFYDLKQLPDHTPTDVDGSTAKEIANHVKILSDFFQREWDESVLQKYYQAKDVMITPQIFMPKMASEEATKAFGVDKETKGLHWVVLYKGTVTPPHAGSYRFVGWGDDLLAVRLDRQAVFAAAYPQALIPEMCKKVFPTLSSLPKENIGKDMVKGKWFTLEKGKNYPMEVLCTEAYGGLSAYMLMIEEQNPEKPYPHRTDDPEHLAYPVFQLKKGIPIPSGGYETAPDPVIFTAK